MYAHAVCTYILYYYLAKLFLNSRYNTIQIKKIKIILIQLRTSTITIYTTLIKFRSI